MRGVPWKDQIAVGRVFELRSSAKGYLPPCALVIRMGSWEREVCKVDRFGCVGDHLYTRRHNHKIYFHNLRDIEGKIVRRRPDLERFGLEDLELIRYGYSVDFNGRIHDSHEIRIPHVWPGEWTVFWVRSFEDSDWIKLWTLDDEWRRISAGAWHFDNHGGSRSLGYKYGRVWATMHTGSRLRQIREFLFRKRPDIIEQQVRVIRWQDQQREYTSHIGIESPALGTLSLTWKSLTTDNMGFQVGGVHL